MTSIPIYYVAVVDAGSNILWLSAGQYLTKQAADDALVGVKMLDSTPEAGTHYAVVMTFSTFYLAPEEKKDA